jgi:hypothetical protein
MPKSANYYEIRVKPGFWAPRRQRPSAVFWGLEDASMTTKSAIATLALAMGAIGSSTASSSGAEAVLAEFYGSGVHHYFAGDFDRAEADLTAAIKGGTRDPRAYYFRALAEMRSGRDTNVAADLRAGAALESADLNQFYPVGKALERVQGANRMTIERYRSLARAEAFQRRHDQDLIRYEQRRRAESQVLRSSAAAPVPAPPADLIPPEEVPALPAKGKDLLSDKPAADAAEDAAVEEPAAEMPPESAPAEDPFTEEPPAKADDTQPPAAPASPETDENPFGDDPPDPKQP